MAQCISFFLLCDSRCPLHRAAGTVHPETPAVLHALWLPGLRDRPEEQGDQEGHTQWAGGLRFHQQRGAGGICIPRDHQYGEDTCLQCFKFSEFLARGHFRFRKETVWKAHSNSFQHWILSINVQLMKTCKIIFFLQCLLSNSSEISSLRHCVMFCALEQD